MNNIYNGDSIELLKYIKENTIHLVLSDIPYGIGYDNWDVLHENTNNAYLGSSPAQQKAGNVFKRRGKPLNGWSESDKLIPIQYYNWVSLWVQDLLLTLIPGSSAFIFCGRRFAHRCVAAFEDAGFIFKDTLVWEKQSATLRAQHVSNIFLKRNNTELAYTWEGWRLGNLRPIYEPILWFMKPYNIGTTLIDNIIKYNVGGYNENILKKYNQKTNNLFSFKYEKEDRGLHPTQKPLKLMEMLIELTTIPGQTVLDPFCGSGTTLLAAKNLERNYIGIEYNEEYYNIAKNRLSC